MDKYRFTEYFENEVLRKRPTRDYAGGSDDDPQCVSRQAVQTMKLNYYADTDSLYIDLSERPSAESREISEGVVLDYDSAGNLVGIDIDNASAKVQMDTLTLNKLPSTVETIAG